MVSLFPRYFFFSSVFPFSLGSEVEAADVLVPGELNSTLPPSNPNSITGFPTGLPPPLTPPPPSPPSPPLTPPEVLTGSTFNGPGEEVRGCGDVPFRGEGTLSPTPPYFATFGSEDTAVVAMGGTVEDVLARPPCSATPTCEIIFPKEVAVVREMVPEGAEVNVRSDLAGDLTTDDEVTLPSGGLALDKGLRGFCEMMNLRTFWTCAEVTFRRSGSTFNP